MKVFNIKHIETNEVITVHAIGNENSLLVSDEKFGLRYLYPDSFRYYEFKSWV